MIKHIVIANDEFFKAHLDIFQHKECTVLKSVISDDLFKDDEIHMKLAKIRRKADKDLRDYEFNKRFP